MRGLLIPVTGAVTEVEWDENPDQWQRLIGATSLDFITIREVGVQVMVGDWSLVDGSAFNERASWLMLGLGRANRVHGTTLVVGLDPETGDGADLYDALIQAATMLPTQTPGT